MVSIKVNYDENLRTQCLHLKSNTSIETDAPTDNNGKGERFSPTDLLATSLAACMITVMGIQANKKRIDFEARAEVQKIMSSEPRKVAEVKVQLTMNGSLSENDRKFLETTARNCPVALSLSEQLMQTVEFIYE